MEKSPFFQKSLRRPRSSSLIRSPHQKTHRNAEFYRLIAQKSKGSRKAHDNECFKVSHKAKQCTNLTTQHIERRLSRMTRLEKHLRDEPKGTLFSPAFASPSQRSEAATRVAQRTPTRQKSGPSTVRESDARNSNARKYRSVTQRELRERDPSVGSGRVVTSALSLAHHSEKGSTTRKRRRVETFKVSCNCFIGLRDLTGRDSNSKAYQTLGLKRRGRHKRE